MSFLCRVSELSLRLRSSDIQEELKAEPLLLSVERSQLRWFEHLPSMPSGHLPGEVLWEYPIRPDSRHTGEIKSLSWPGNAFIFLQRSCGLVRGSSGNSCLDCYVYVQIMAPLKEVYKADTTYCCSQKYSTPSPQKTL